MAGPPPLGERLRRRLDGWLWLGEALSRARAQAPEQAAEVGRLHRASWYRLQTARDLREAHAVPAAGAIYREALLLAVRAVEESRAAGGGALSREAARERLGELAAVAGGAHSGDRSRWFSEARRFLADDDPLALDGAPPAVARARLDVVDRAACALLETVEPRSPRRLLLARALRVGSLALLALGSLGALGYQLARPPNVALGKPAAASGYWPGSAPADALVNGKAESPWGAATARGKNAWFSVDLLAPHRLDRIVVVNRDDRYARDTPPLVLELSDDGQSWQEAARFTQDGRPGKRWTWRARGRTARWVRVSRPDKNFALSEIEVYGRPL